jgi:uncharacterized phage protein gp47/JayE
MFEDMTFENLLQDKLDTVNSKYDKREGSIIYDALAPNSAEDAQVYITLEWMFAQQHGETASRENLIKIAYDTRGIKPYDATYAQLKAVFNIPVDIGERFSLDDYNYVVVELLDEETNTYLMQCETIGTAGNKRLGTLIPINYIQGLKSAELTEVVVYAHDEEDTEVFRQRWRDSFNATAFGGNKADYKEKIMAINGVGGVKVERGTNAAGEKVGGYVRCTVISSNYDVPSEELIDNIQTIIDPEVNQGEGDGLAPIGAVATIRGVIGYTVNIDTNITYDTDYTFEDVKLQIGDAVDDYFKELASSWAASKTGLVVRIAMIESAILAIPGIIDVGDTQLNGVDANVILDIYSIPVRGIVNG